MRARPQGPERSRWLTRGKGRVLLAAMCLFTFAQSLDGSAAGAQQVAPPASGTEATPAAQGALAVADAPAQGGARWIFLLGTSLLIGIAGVRFGVLRTLGHRGALPELRTRMRRGLWKWGWVALALLLLALPLRMAAELAAVGGGIGALSNLLLRTPWGAGWWLHLMATALAGIGLYLATPRGLGDRGWGILAGAALLLPLVSALQSHGMQMAGGRGPAVASHYLHVAGAGLWLGGLLLLLTAGLPAARRAVASPEELGEDPKELPTLARMVNAFSRLAVLSVGLLLLTGLVNAWIQVGTISNLFGTPYGRSLLIKLGVVAGALLLGFYNWRRVRPTLAERPDPGALRIPAAVEAALGLLVLFLAAVLASTPPP